MITASAPVGVRNAPILLPIIEANTADLKQAPVIFIQRFEYKILIGIMLIKLLAINDDLRGLFIFV